MAVNGQDQFGITVPYGFESTEFSFDNLLICEYVCNLYVSFGTLLYGNKIYLTFILIANINPEPSCQHLYGLLSLKNNLTGSS